jgi:hypothetical protein
MRLWRVEVFWLTLVAGLLFLLWWLPGGSSINSDSYSVSFSGKKALFQALRRLENNVQRSTEQLIPSPGQGSRLVILGPARLPTDEEWELLRTEVFSGGTLVFAARLDHPDVDLALFKARVRPLPKDKSPTAGTSTDKDKSAPAPIRIETGDERPESILPTKTTIETDLVETKVAWTTQGYLQLDAPEWQVIGTSLSKPQVAIRPFGRGAIVLLASDDIFGNGNLIEPDRAVLAFRLLETAPSLRGTWIDETLNSSGVPKDLGILFDPFVRPLTLQCILLVILFGWAGSYRFGPISQSSSVRRRSIVEHAQAVGVLYYRAGAGAHTVRALHEFLKQELRRLYGGTFRVDSAAAVARAAQADEAEVRTLLQQAASADNSRLLNSAATKILRGLSQLISKIRKR